MGNIPHRTKDPFQHGEASARLTGSGGLAWMLRRVRVKSRRRGVDEAQMLLADNAYYCGEVVAFCRERGWDYTLNVSHDGYRHPVLNALPELTSACWESMDDPSEAEPTPPMRPAAGNAGCPPAGRGRTIRRSSAPPTRRPAPAGAAARGDPHQPFGRRAAIGGGCPPQQTGMRERLERAARGLGTAPPAAVRSKPTAPRSACALQLEALSEHDRSIGTLIRRWMGSAARLVRRGGAGICCSAALASTPSNSCSHAVGGSHRAQGDPNGQQEKPAKPGATSRSFRDKVKCPNTMTFCHLRSMRMSAR